MQAKLPGWMVVLLFGLSMGICRAGCRQQVGKEHLKVHGGVNGNEEYWFGHFAVLSFSEHLSVPIVHELTT
jgi:hypothetical protein